MWVKNGSKWKFVAGIGNMIFYGCVFSTHIKSLTGLAGCLFIVWVDNLINPKIP
jgi:hypothetical protein